MKSLEERKKAKEEELKKRVPQCCPLCCGLEIYPHLIDWFAHSLDPSDLENTALLLENQCRDCGRSFWT